MLTAGSLPIPVLALVEHPCRLPDAPFAYTCLTNGRLPPRTIIGFEAHRAGKVWIWVNRRLLNEQNVPCHFETLHAQHTSVMPFDGGNIHLPGRSLAKVTQDVPWLNVLWIMSLTMHVLLLHQRHRMERATFNTIFTLKVGANNLVLTS